jgi:hypothetical protein
MVTVLSPAVAVGVPSVVPPLGSTLVTAKVVTELGVLAVPLPLEPHAATVEAARSADAVISARAEPMAAERSGA